MRRNEMTILSTIIVLASFAIVALPAIIAVACVFADWLADRSERVG